MNKTLIWIIIAGIIAVIIVVLIWRNPAAAQESEGAAPRALLDVAMQNVQALGSGGDYDFVGVVEEVEEAALMLASESEFFLEYSDGALRPITLSELQAGGQLPSGYEETLFQVFRGEISPGDMIFRIFLDGQQTHLVMSSDASRVAGLFPMASRLPTAGQYQSVRRDADRRRECTRRILSYDIFGREAETLIACTQAMCSADAPFHCELTEIDARSSWFGSVLYQPEAPPEPGEVLASFCRGVVQYKWAVVLGPVRVKDFVDFEVMNARLGGQGNLISEINCGN